MEKNLVVVIQKTEDMGNATLTLNVATQMYLSANALLLRQILHRSKRLLLMLYQILPRFSPAESVGIDSNSTSLQSFGLHEIPLLLMPIYLCRSSITGSNLINILYFCSITNAVSLQAILLALKLLPITVNNFSPPAVALCTREK